MAHKVIEIENKKMLRAGLVGTMFFVLGTYKVRAILDERHRLEYAAMEVRYLEQQLDRCQFYNQKIRNMSKRFAVARMFKRDPDKALRTLTAHSNLVVTTTAFIGIFCLLGLDTAHDAVVDRRMLRDINHEAEYLKNKLYWYLDEDW